MSKITIKGNASSGRIWVDGHELNSVTKIELIADPNRACGQAMTTVAITIAADEFEIEGEGTVSMTPQAARTKDDEAVRVIAAAHRALPSGIGARIMAKNWLEKRGFASIVDKNNDERNSPDWIGPA